MTPGLSKKIYYYLAQAYTRAHMPALTMYQLQPHLFAYNNLTKKHMLRSGRAYKKAFAANPEHFVDTISMMPPSLAPKPRVVQVVPEPEPQPEIEAKIDAPIPAPAPIKKHDVAREQVRALISDDVKQNASLYAGKTKESLGALFRELLLERLAIPAAPTKATASSVNKTSKPVKPASKPVKKKPLFKLRPQVVPTSEDEDEGDAYSDDSDE